MDPTATLTSRGAPAGVAQETASGGAAGHALQPGREVDEAAGGTSSDTPDARPGPIAAWDDRRRDLIMRWALIVLWLFNLEDYVLTQAALRSGAIESNVLFAYFLDRGPGPALAFKLGVVTLGCLLLWRFRTHPLAVVASLGLALAYVLVTVFHLTVALA